MQHHQRNRSSRLGAAMIGSAVLVATLAGSAAVSSAAPAYRDAVVAQTPLFYWRMNETSTGPMATEVDNSPNDANGANTQTTITLGTASLRPPAFTGFEAGNVGFTFPGGASGDFVSTLTTTASRLDTGSVAGTVINWIKTTTGTSSTVATPTASTFGTLYRGDAGATGSLATFVDGTGKFGLRIANQANDALLLADVRTTANVNDGNWHQVAATWDDATNTAVVYVDGALATSGLYSDGLTPDDNDAGDDVAFTFTGRHQFGKGTNNASLYRGDADELAIWNVALTSTQIAAVYAGAGAATVPEPATLGLLAGVALLATRRRRNVQDLLPPGVRSRS